MTYHELKKELKISYARLSKVIDLTIGEAQKANRIGGFNAAFNKDDYRGDLLKLIAKAYVAYCAQCEIAQ
jgi:hypothetical protein